MKRPATICVFAKPPLPGTAKTRLAASIGEGPAAELAAAFLEDTWSAVGRLEWAQPVLAVTDEAAFRFWPADVPRWPQGGGDLGLRLERVLGRALERGHPALAVGADTPGLPTRLLEQARAALERADAVLGPAEDGGFYLLGMRVCPAGALAELPWSEPRTFSATLVRLRELGLQVAVLEPWFDVDRLEDLSRLAVLIRAGGVAASATARALVAHGFLPSAPASRSCV